MFQNGAAAKAGGSPRGRGAQETPRQRLDTAVVEAQPLRKVHPRRSVLEVRMDILTVVKDGAAGPTQIMFKANLSWKIVTHNLKELVRHGVLSEHKVGNKSSYELTDKGVVILRSYLTVADKFDVPDHYGVRSLQ
jgi:predicted transcriptional regulator